VLGAAPGAIAAGAGAFAEGVGVTKGAGGFEEGAAGSGEGLDGAAGVLVWAKAPAAYKGKIRTAILKPAPLTGPLFPTETCLL
jgi:hypothetical protein